MDTRTNKLQQMRLKKWRVPFKLSDNNVWDVCHQDFLWVHGALDFDLFVHVAAAVKAAMR